MWMKIDRLVVDNTYWSIIAIPAFLSEVSNSIILNAYQLHSYKQRLKLTFSIIMLDVEDRIKHFHKFYSTFCRRKYELFNNI